MQELPADVKQKKNIFLSAANDCDTKYFCRWRHGWTPAFAKASTYAEASTYAKASAYAKAPADKTVGKQNGHR